jgi:hypothetical protein
LFEVFLEYLERRFLAGCAVGPQRG